MKILIPTIGSRGDIQPYINISQQLSKNYQPIIASHPCWRGLVEEYELEFAPIGPDIDIEYESSKLRGSSKVWIIGMMRTMNFIMRIMKESSQDLLNLYQDIDVVLVTHTNLGVAEAEYCKKPYFNVTLQPMFLKDQSKEQTLYTKVLGRMIGGMMVRPYNKLRRNFDLPKVGSLEELLGSSLNIIPLSKHVFPANPGWNQRHKLVGYWFTVEPKEWQPPLKLVEFLEAGEAPVIIALGAMGFDTKDERHKVQVLIDAVTKLGLRAIIQGFANTIKEMDLPDHVLHVGSVSHNWLFPKGLFIIHHGGFGTTASTFRSGKPAIVIPHMLDQFLFAQKIAELKVGPQGIPASKLTYNRLLEAMSHLIATPKYFYNASELANKLVDEQGLESSLALIDEYMADVATN